ncbi:MAG: ribosomal protein S18-alanine N-acetyltransferase [Gemmatimonadaceae bacterium]
MLVIRVAEPADIPAIAAIEHASFGDPWTATAFRSLLRNDRTLFDVALAGAANHLVGYVVAWAVADEGEVANLAVAANARGGGVGSELLEHILLRLSRRGARSVYLEVRASNRAARSLYVRHGFAEVGRRRRYYREPSEDGLIMCLVLEAAGLDTTHEGTKSK